MYTLYGTPVLNIDLKLSKRRLHGLDVNRIYFTLTTGTLNAVSFLDRFIIMSVSLSIWINKVETGCKKQNTKAGLLMIYCLKKQVTK